MKDQMKDIADLMGSLAGDMKEMRKDQQNNDDEIKKVIKQLQSANESAMKEIDGLKQEATAKEKIEIL
ncbi:hypothetical protein FQA39_LY11651 [Lamprigera yunnana]|nr:hypothetical protein FQA39_LY11651 [Lamprigera yunnana]